MLHIYGASALHKCNHLRTNLKLFKLRNLKTSREEHIANINTRLLNTQRYIC